MAQILTSRMNLAQRALYNALTDVSWPSGFSAGVQVFLGEPTEPIPLEWVAVFTSTTATTEPATSNRITERFPLTVRVKTAARHKTPTEASERLDELNAVIEGVMRDQSTGINNVFPDVDGLGAEVLQRSDTEGRTLQQVGPYVGEDGWVVESEFVFPYRARI